MNNTLKYLTVISLLILISNQGLCQTEQFSCTLFSTTATTRTSIIKPTPNQVMWRSVILPGLGQITNRQIWKLPLFYGGFAASLYYFSFSREKYMDFKQAFIYRTDNDPSTIDVYDPLYGSAQVRYSSENQLKYLRDLYRRNMEISVIITAGIYALNILDAYVSAHLRSFDISDDLSFSFGLPNIYRIRENYFFTSGLTLTF